MGNLMDYKDTKYAIYLGRRTDYKNWDWLVKIMKELNINYIPK